MTEIIAAVAIVSVLDVTLGHLLLRLADWVTPRKIYLESKLLFR